MVTGLATFASGLFEATVERAKEKGISIDRAYEEEVVELGQFLEALEKKYQSVKGNGKGSNRRVLAKVVDWIAAGDRKPSRKGRPSQARARRG
jgi:hypothetical protein